MRTNENAKMTDKDGGGVYMAMLDFRLAEEDLKDRICLTDRLWPTR